MTATFSLPENAVMTVIAAIFLAVLFTTAILRYRRHRRAEERRAILAQARRHLETARRAGPHFRGRTRRDCLLLPKHRSALENIAAHNGMNLTDFCTSTEELDRLSNSAREFLLGTVKSENAPPAEKASGAEVSGSSGLYIDLEGAGTDESCQDGPIIEDTETFDQTPAPEQEYLSGPPEADMNAFQPVVVGHTTSGDPIEALQTIGHEQLCDWVDQRFSEMVIPCKAEDGKTE